MDASTPLETCYENNVTDKAEDESTTIIIGAGSIGLWTAFFLARSQQAAKRQSRKIFVIDKNVLAFGATSGTSTGCVHYAFEDQDYLLELGKYSFDTWEQLAQDSSFREAVGWREGSIYGVVRGDGKHHSLLPNWFRASATWDVDTSVLGPQNAMVNPIKLGKWLQKECENAGVHFLFSTVATSAHLNDENSITAISCERKDGPITLTCNSLVIAGGPWTPKVFKSLFPHSSMKYEPAMDPGDWLLIKDPQIIDDKSIAFIGLNNIVGEKLEFAGRNDGTTWVCGRRERTGELPPIGEGGDANIKMISELTGRSYRFLNGQFEQNPERFKELEIIKAGRAFRPSPVSGVPVISLVPATKLTDGNIMRTKSTSCDGGLYLCWGHGAYGIALGAGTGKIMSQIVAGEKPEIAFTIPADTDRTS